MKVKVILWILYKEFLQQCKVFPIIVSIYTFSFLYMTLYFCIAGHDIPKPPGTKYILSIWSFAPVSTNYKCQEGSYLFWQLPASHSNEMPTDIKTPPEYMVLRRQKVTTLLLALESPQHLARHSAHNWHPINTVRKADSLNSNQYYSCAKRANTKLFLRV